MRNPLIELDAILRAQRSSAIARAAAQPGGPPPAIANSRLLLYCGALGAIYGVFMGLYSLSMRGGEGLLQLGASALKIPLLFVLTLCITFPSMYVFSALAGSRLDPRRTLSLLLHAMAITLALAASFAPILGFFTLSTTSYHFMVLLNVGFLGVAGVVGCACLWRSLSRLLADAAMPGEGGGSSARLGAAEDEPESEPVSGPRHAAAPTFPSRSRPDPAAMIFQIWILLFGVVGAQMGWVLRPFIGSPDQPFSLFRARSGNVVQAVGRSLLHLLGLDGRGGL